MPEARRPALPVLLGTLAVLYFLQGLPAGLLAKAVPSLARESGLSREWIGLLGLAAAPWALKFLWAPWVDRLGRGRRVGRRDRARMVGDSPVMWRNPQPYQQAPGHHRRSQHGTNDGPWCRQPYELAARPWRWQHDKTGEQQLEAQ